MLEISLLGEINIRLQGEPLTRFRSQTELALLAYLAHTGQTADREALADLLWEARSTRQSLSNLRTALARLRKKVGDYLVVTRRTVAVVPTVHEQTDSARLRELLARDGPADGPAGANVLQQGLALYKGEFMAGFSLPNAPRFNDWLLVEQENIRQIAMRGYRQLAARQQEAGAFGDGVITAQKWAAWEPLDERAQQQLMRLLIFDGRAAEALAVYEKFEGLLQEELGIPPAPATTKLYQAILDGSLAPPETTPAPRHNLPRALTPLIGRRTEIKKLTGLLADPDYPLVSITGAGGMGKTSLALAIGRQLLVERQHPFSDGIWFVALEAVEDNAPEEIREEVAAAAGEALGLYFHGERDLWSQLLGQLSSKKVLLILDNIEQILTAATDLIVELLDAGEGVQLLVTSRRSLALAAAVAFPLAGLPAPAEVSLEALRNESVRLFAERAARLPLPFHVANHLAAVVEICQFVQGAPLAIELAAAALGRLMVDEILPALRGNIGLLNSGQRDRPARQRTLQAVFETSWQLLDLREQTALAQISIFRGGFTRPAAAAVLGERTSTLYSLQHHALLNRDEKGRFRLHPLVRQLAREKLGGPTLIDLEEQSLRRHSSYYAAFMQSFTADLRRGAGQEALQQIIPEQANLRAAWEHAVHAGQWQAVATGLEGSHYFYQRKGFFAEEAALIDEALTRLPLESGDPALTALLSRLLAVRAQDHLHSAQFERGVDCAERACALAQQLDDEGLEGQARLAWARILSTQHKRDEALEQFEKVVALARKSGDQFLEADGWIGVGGQLIWQEDGQLTQEALNHALDLCRAVQYQSGEIETLRYLGTMEMRSEGYATAADYHQQALALSRLLGDVAAEAEELGSLGVTLTLQGDLPGSQKYQQEALATFRRLNMTESVAWLLGELGYTAVRLGDYTRAEELLGEALAISNILEDAFWQAWVKLRLGMMWHERGQSAKGLPLIIAAFQTAEQFNYLNFKAAVLYDWGNLLLSREDWVTAEQKFQEAFDLRQGSGRTEQALPSLAGLAYVTWQQGRLETAAAHAERLWQTWLESPPMADRANLKVYWMLGIVWEGLGDGRAGDLWQKATALLQARSEKIGDERGRRMFLEGVPAHRAILNIKQGQP